MAKTIWKYPIQTTDEQSILVPKGAKFLTVQTQREEPCLWAVVDPTAEKEEVMVRTHGTGHELPADAHLYDYIGTYQLGHGSLIFHVFRVMSDAEMVMKAFHL